MVICLERCADLHMAQLMPLPLTVSCFSKIQIGLPFWYRLTWVVPDKGPLNGCVCVCVCVYVTYSVNDLRPEWLVKCEARASRHQPTVAKLALNQVMTAHAFRKQMWLRTDLLHMSQPTHWSSCGFTSHSTQTRSFRTRCQSPGLVWKKLNLTQQKHVFTNQMKCTTAQNKHKKTKARFSHILWHLAWKRSRFILNGKDKGGDK